MKYMIKADIKVNGTVQRKDIIGAIMGQTEGLLGDDSNHASCSERLVLVTLMSKWKQRAVKCTE